MRECVFLNLKLERVWQRDYAIHTEAMIDITCPPCRLLQQRAPALEPRLPAAREFRAEKGKTTYRSVRSYLTAYTVRSYFVGIDGCAEQSEVVGLSFLVPQAPILLNLSRS